MPDIYLGVKITGPYLVVNNVFLFVSQDGPSNSEEEEKPNQPKLLYWPASFFVWFTM
jgi:hypothetical protein